MQILFNIVNGVPQNQCLTGACLYYTIFPKMMHNYKDSIGPYY